jgi:hypothetical protein
MPMYGNFVKWFFIRYGTHVDVDDSVGVSVSVGGAIDERDGTHCIRIAPQLPDNCRAGNLGDPNAVE